MRTGIDITDAVTEISKRFWYLNNRAINRATARAMNDAIKQGRTIVKRAITAQYNIPASYLNNRMLPINNARPGNLTATLSVSSNSVPIGKFKGLSQRKGSKNRRGGVSVAIKKGERKLLKGTFLLKNGKQGKGVMHRADLNGNSAYKDGSFQFRHSRINKSGSDAPIGALFTLSPFGAVVSKDVTKVAQSKAEKAFSTRLNYHMEKLIKAM